ncbi:TylF/MycF/NovP-related O-methyltransferase [Methanobrevibacter sp.]
MIIIYGAGMTGKSILKDLISKGEKNENILFADSDDKLWNKYVENILVIPPEDINHYNYSKIIIGAAMGREAIIKLLTEKLGVNESLIEKDNPFVESYFKSYAVREQFMENYSEVLDYRGIKGNVAEGGVYEGRFTRVLSRIFPDRKLYLFDTFEGFDIRDVTIDQNNNYSTNIREGMYTPSKSIDSIINSLSHPENVICCKGYFPESAKEIDDSFVFVNLDFDLYKPTLEGLRFFWPKLVKGGVILVHDYFNAQGIIEEDRYTGIRAAVTEFSAEAGISYMPIGDTMSVAFIK